MSIYDERPWLKSYPRGAARGHRAASSTTRWRCSAPPRAAHPDKPRLLLLRRDDHLRGARRDHGRARGRAPGQGPRARATASPSTCRTCRSSRSRCSRRGRPAAIMVSVNPMLRHKERRGPLLDGLGRQGARHARVSCGDDVAKEVAPDTARRDRHHDLGARLQRRRSRRCSPRPSASRDDSTFDLLELAEEHDGPEAVRDPGPRPRRRRLPDLHVGHHRPAQGRHEHARQRRVQLAGLPRLMSARRRRRHPRRRPAVPHHRADRAPHRGLLDGDADRARSTGSTPTTRSTLHRAPQGDVHRGRDHGLHRADERPDVSSDRDVSSFTKMLQRRGADRASRRSSAFERQFGAYIHNIYGLTETTSPSHGVPIGARAPVDPDVGRAVRRRADLQHRRARRRRGGQRRRARRASASSSPPARRSSPATGTSRRRPSTRCPAARCTPATWASWTPTAGSTSSTARRT